MASRRRLRIGVAGLGRAFTLMLPTFLKDPRVQLVAACDPLPRARERFAQDFSAPAFETVEQLCADQQVELVYVATPHQFHAAHVCLAAAHGKHVLVEKPMAITLAECDAMIGAAHGAGTHVIVGHSHSFNAPVRRAVDIIRGGSLGAVRMVHALNYTDFLYRPRRPEELDTVQGGGVVFSQAAHQIDVVRLLANSPVRSVRAHTGNWDPQRRTEGAYSALLEFASGAFASATYSGYGHFDSDALMGWMGELGQPKSLQDYGAARKRLAAMTDPEHEAYVKAERNYGGSLYQPPASAAPPAHQHFGHVVVSCERGDLRLTASGVERYGDNSMHTEALPAPRIPREEVIDELWQTLVEGKPPVHDGIWARDTLAVCLAMLRSARERQDIILL
jgi:phthalate 4,5-cis-dihydrodiol dehydrogenase